MVDPAELHRVYPPVADNNAAEPTALPRNDAAETELRIALAKLAAAEQRCADAHDQIGDLRQRLNAEAEDRRQAQAQLAETQAKLTAVLTDQRSTSTQSPSMVALGAHMKGGFTLAKLAEALRGMPRDARLLIRLPDGQLVEIDL